MAVCPKCGNNVPESNNFCMKCGYNMKENPTAASPADENTQNIRQAQSDAPNDWQHPNYNAQNTPQYQNYNPQNAQQHPNYNSQNAQQYRPYNPQYGSQYNSQYPNSPQGKNKKWIIPVIISGAALIIIAAAVFLVFMLQSSSPKKTVENTFEQYKERFSDIVDDNLDDLLDSLPTELSKYRSEIGEIVSSTFDMFEIKVDKVDISDDTATVSFTVYGPDFSSLENLSPSVYSSDGISGIIDAIGDCINGNKIEYVSDDVNLVKSSNGSWTLAEQDARKLNKLETKLSEYIKKLTKKSKDLDLDDIFDKFNII